MYESIKSTEYSDSLIVEIEHVSKIERLYISREDELNKQTIKLGE